MNAYDDDRFPYHRGREQRMMYDTDDTSYESMEAVEGQSHQFSRPIVYESNETPYKSMDKGLAKQNSKNKMKYKDYIPPDEEVSLEEIYVVRQNYGYFAILFSLAQTCILVTMMVKCGVAPMKINPMYGPYPEVLSEWGGKNSYLILDEHEWWRLITPILLHAGVIHLLCNVLVQLETGVFFEKEWGSLRWFIIYVTSGIGSSILSVIIKTDAISVGSSGAVMGLFGGKLAEVCMRACERVRTKQDHVGRQVRKEQCVAVTCSVIVVLAFSFIPYVDWAAHLGGLLSGLAVGIFIFACEIESVIWRLAWSMVGIAATVAYFYATLDYMYSGKVQPSPELQNVCQYYQQALGDNYQCHCQRNG